MKILRTIYTLCAAALLCSGCQDEEMIKQSGVKEGIPVTIDLTFSAAIPQQETVGTRATTDPEHRVNDLYVLIFNKNTGALKSDEDGNKCCYFYSYSQLTTGGNTQTEANNTLVGTLSNIKTTTGESVIYAIANVKNPPSEYSLRSEGQPLADRIQAVTSISELEAITAELSAPNSSNALFRITDTHYIMSGSLECAITTTGISGSTDIPLYRTDSKVTFNIQVGTGSKCTNFTLLSYQVCKVAKKTALVPLAEGRNYDTGSENADNYWNTEAGIQPEETNTLTFYVPENIKSVTTDADISKYEDREKWDVTNSNKDNPVPVDNRDFINAPDNGTYVVLHGLFEGEALTNNYHPEDDSFQKEDVEARATVDYIIHLGDWSKNDFTSFSNKRNYEYTYTITVNGVDDIVVEVEKEGNPEDEPGAEGDVFFQNGVFYNVDCHNVALLMEFTKQEIVNVGESEDYFQAVINSPFGADDKDWLRFVLNDIDGSGNYVRSLHSYPGDPGQIADAESTYLTLDELMAALKDIRDAHLANSTSSYEDANGDLVVTCFVKEYTYDDYGSYLGSEASVPANSDNWGYYTNKSNREAYIFGAINYSPDGNSSTIHTKYVILQRSIQTADEYVGYGESGGVGLGIETFNETGDLPMGNPSKKPDSSFDGRGNMEKMLETLGTGVGSAMWGYTEAPETGNVYQSFPEKYKYAAYACLLRNRDENGDGEIEGDEIKWYLPALDQYTAVYVGMDALSNESKLYSPTVTSYTNETLRHYFTGTWADDDPYIIWAEEGLSTQIFGSSTDDRYPSSANSGDYLTGKYRDYRCVRNLGGNDLEDRTPFYTQNGNIFTINHQKNGVFRSKVTNASLDEHNQEDIENRVYRKFQVAQNYIDKDSDGDYLEEDMDDADGEDDGDDWYSGEEIEESDPCANYSEEHDGGDRGSWRLPNQRELLVMMTEGNIFVERDFEYWSDDDDIPEDKEWILDEGIQPRKKHVYKVFSATTFKFKETPVPWNKGQVKYRYYVQANGNDDVGVTDFIMQLQALDINDDGQPNFGRDGDNYPSYGFVRCVRDVE